MARRARPIFRRIGLPTSLVLALPLFLVYQAGVLLVPVASGADLVTAPLWALCGHDRLRYLAALGGAAAVLAILHRRGKVEPPRFAPVLIESGIYALSLGTLIVLVMIRLLGIDPRLAAAAAGPSLLAKVVISAGAGFHEELVFRQATLAGLAWLGRARLGPRGSIALAFAASALLFSLAHHVGPDADPLTPGPFVYRSLAGLAFGALFWWRGFAVAAWTHALYDLYVFLLRG